MVFRVVEGSMLVQGTVSGTDSTPIGLKEGTFNNAQSIFLENPINIVLATGTSSIVGAGEAVVTFDSDAGTIVVSGTPHSSLAGAAVTSLNTLTDAVTVSGFDGITVAEASQSINLTGFQSEFTSASGSLQTQIDNLGTTDLQEAYDNGTGVIQTTTAKPVTISGVSGEEDFRVVGSGTFTEALTVGENTTYLNPHSITTASGIFDKTLTISGLPVHSTSHTWDEITSNTKFIPFDTAVGDPSYIEGRLFYDKDEHTVAVFNDESDVKHQLGQEGFIRVFNNSGSTIVNGKPVYLSGVEVVEDRPTVGLARSDAKSTSQVIGVTTHDIENNTFGYITYWGLINDVDTSSFSTGDTLFLDETTAGSFRVTVPPQGNFEVQVGFVVKSDASTGRILVNLNQDLASLAGDAFELVVDAQKATAGTISAGQVVYVAGYDTGPNVVEVELADSSSSATMPALGITRDSITQSSTGKIVVVGRLTNIDTSSFSIGDKLYVSETPGTLTSTKPTGTALIQTAAIVSRSHPSQGILEVVFIGRENDLPNLAENRVWLGDASGVPQQTLVSSLAVSNQPDIDSINTVTGTLTLDGSDGISLVDETVNSDTPTITVSGFRTEFVNASGSLQNSIDAIDSSVTLQEAYDNGDGTIVSTNGTPVDITHLDIQNRIRMGDSDISDISSVMKIHLTGSPDNNVTFSGVGGSFYGVLVESPPGEGVYYQMQTTDGNAWYIQQDTPTPDFSLGRDDGAGGFIRILGIDRDAPIDSLLLDSSGNANATVGVISPTGTFSSSLTISGVPVHIGSIDEVEPALVGADGISIASGTSTITLTGFRTEFVNASGSLQNSIDAIDSSVTLQEAYDNGTGVIETSGGKPVVVSGQLGVNTSSPSEAFHVIGSGIISGRLGIGISPTVELEVDGAGVFDNNLDEDNSVIIDSGLTSTQRSTLIFSDRGTQYWTIRKEDDNNFKLVSGQDPFPVAIEVESGGTSGQDESIYITSDGLIGINSSSPSERLHVVGSGIFDGDLDVLNGTFTAPTGTFADSLTISGVPVHIGSIDEVEPALVGADGITVASGTSTITLTGFRTEFVNASGSLQGQIDSIDSSVTLQDAYDNGDGTIITTAGKDLVIGGDENVEIGKSSSSSKLTVSGGASFDNNVDSENEVIIDSGATTGQESSLIFADQGTNRWAVKKLAGNGFTIADVDGGNNVVTIEAGARQNAIRIDNAGNVGIGFSNPSVALTVSGSGLFDNNVNATNSVTVDSGDTVSQRSVIALSDMGSQIWSIRKETDNNFKLVSAEGSFPTLIEIEDGGAAAQDEALYIDADGLVGIGTSSPSEKLDVVGSGTFSGDVIADGGAFTTSLTISGAPVITGSRHYMGFSVAGDLATGDGAALPIYVPFTGQVIKAAAVVGTAPTGDSIDLQINNTTAAVDMLTATDLSIAAAATTDTSTSFTNPNVSEGDILRLDVDQVGSSTAGADLQVVLYVDVNLEGS